MAVVLRLVILIIIVAGAVSVLRNRDLGRQPRAFKGDIAGAVSVLPNRDLGRQPSAVKGDIAGAVREAQVVVTNGDAPAVSGELKRSGRVVRRKVTKAAQTVAAVTEDSRTTAAIKTKLAVDPELSALDLSVDTRDGRVTLAGRVPSTGHLARAVQLALAVDNVDEVVSTLQVRPPRRIAAK